MSDAQICDILQRKVLCVAMISLCLHVLVFAINIKINISTILWILSLLGLVTTTLLCCGVPLRCRCLLIPFMLYLIALEIALMAIFIVLTYVLIFHSYFLGTYYNIILIAVLLVFISLLGWMLRTTQALDDDIGNDNERVAGITNGEAVVINHHQIIDHHRQIINEIIEHPYIPALQLNGDNFAGSHCGEVGLGRNGTDAQEYITRTLWNSLNENVDNLEYEVDPTLVYHETSRASIETINRQYLPPSYEEAMAKIFYY